MNLNPQTIGKIVRFNVPKNFDENFFDEHLEALEIEASENLDSSVEWDFVSDNQNQIDVCIVDAVCNQEQVENLIKEACEE